ncbi:hypothetical protein GCM10028790_47010 [Micromonospora taraxaci]|uniref:Uncharacterized protein n=1 Tax=Micromonospora taraxaci TaxID=1316803 RepID=A0A561VER4_9ACTN|nr:hypothetical protein [Micromonospora taraxaci]TWG10096.1 hypothetical protein FHU34_12549 [Micromonospora taraxaci]
MASVTAVGVGAAAEIVGPADRKADRVVVVGSGSAGSDWREAR